MKKIESQLDKLIENELKCIHTVIVEVKENELVRKVIDGWKERYKFDEQTFTNSVSSSISIRITEVQRLK